MLMRLINITPFYNVNVLRLDMYVVSNTTIE